MVSIIIPAYRASGDIAVALDSVFSQTFANFEVIVVNDGSPDTPDLERALEPYASRIRYIAFTENRGAGAARNAGVLAAHGTYLAFLDADDRWSPEFLQRQVWHLEARPACDMVYCDAILSGESPLAGRRFMETAPSHGPVTLIGLIEQRCNIILSTVVLRRSAIVRAGLFDETLRRGQDFELWLRLALHGAQIEYQRHVLAERRIRAEGLSGSSVTELQRAIAVLERFGRGRELDCQARTSLRIRLMALVDQLEVEQGKLRILEGNFAAAEYHLGASRRQTLKLRAVRLALKTVPTLVRAAYLRRVSVQSRYRLPATVEM
ncbi:MAG TPA: glycosyltransferase family A protein [Vicinamibacterales bacterium]|nr:glycosyltransferase family A protein [Vicinamibacterales bacterium]